MDYLPSFVVEGGGGTITFVPRKPVLDVKVGAREKAIDTDIDELLNSFKPSVEGGKEPDSEAEEDLTEKLDEPSKEIDEPITEEPTELSEPVDAE